MLLAKHVVEKNGRTAFRLFSVLLLLVIVCMITLPVYPSLVIRDTRSNQLVWSSRLGSIDTFGIRWTHSIHRSVIEEHYRVTDGQIILSDMTFHDYGIGMENELAPGEELVIANGQFQVRSMNRIFPALHLFVGQIRANHTLLFSGTEIPLGSIEKPGEAITIQSENRSLLSELGGY